MQDLVTLFMLNFPFCIHANTCELACVFSCKIVTVLLHALVVYFGPCVKVFIINMDINKRIFNLEKHTPRAQTSAEVIINFYKTQICNHNYFLRLDIFSKL